MIVYAHRGLSSLYPENTLEAFKKALEYKIGGIETDVQMSKDGELMIFHDEYLERTTNGKGFLKDFTKAELKKLNANNHKEGFYEIPTLDELLTLVKDEDIIINLELKTSIFEYEGIEEKVYQKLIEYDILDKTIISSFNHYSLVRLRKMDKNLKLGVLTADRIVNVENYVRDIGSTAYHPFFAALSPKSVALCHENKVEVNAWTIDDNKYFDLIKSMGVDGIITNCVQKFCEKK